MPLIWGGEITTIMTRAGCIVIDFWVLRNLKISILSYKYRNFCLKNFLLETLTLHTLNISTELRKKCADAILTPSTEYIYQQLRLLLGRNFCWSFHLHVASLQSHGTVEETSGFFQNSLVPSHLSPHFMIALLTFAVPEFHSMLPPMSWVASYRRTAEKDNYTSSVCSGTFVTFFSFISSSF